MTNPLFWRAYYDEDRDTFVVLDAGWGGERPTIEYRFDHVEYEDEGEHLLMLEKWWLDDNDLPTIEGFAFAEYTSDDDFRDTVQRILAHAQQVSDERNLDYFLAIIDRVKVLAVDNGFADDSIFDFEGLFEDGPEDAYTLREPHDHDARLHARVVRSRDECWRIHCAPVSDPEGQALGWAVVALLYPGLTSAATEETIAAATQAELIDIDHWQDKLGAHLAVEHLYRFMHEGDRVRDPEYADIDDSKVFEFMSIGKNHGTVSAPAWYVLEGDDLRALRAGEHTLVRERSRWKPQPDIINRFAGEMGLSDHITDQFRARLIDEMRLSEPFDEDSPWRYLDEDRGQTGHEV